MPMDRLLREIDSLVASGRIDEEVVVQTPAVQWIPSRLTIRNVVPFDDLQALIRDARVVVSHAGPGNLAAIRAAGKVPVVVPRDERFGEHVDSHQRRYAARLAADPGYVVVQRIEELAQALESAQAAKPGTNRGASDESIALLKRLFEGCGA